MSTFKVLIIGSGVAGPALAFWLNRLSTSSTTTTTTTGLKYAVTLVERSPHLRAQGQQIDLRGQGVTAMRRMGLEQRVREKVVHEDGVQLLDKRGRQMAVLRANRTGTGRQAVSSEFEIMRGDMVRILYDATREENEYVFGAAVTALRDGDGGDKLVASFADGREEEYDLVVGADGQNSRTRRMMPGADGRDPFASLGVYMAYFTIPRTEGDSSLACIHHMPGARVVATRADNPRTCQCAFALLAESPYAERIRRVLRAPVEEQRTAWAEVFSEGGPSWQTPRFLESLLHNPLSHDSFYMYDVGQVKTEKWSSGRAVLLGDAAWCASPMTGFGTSLAMVGAYVLAGELTQNTMTRRDGSVTVDVPAALGQYDKVLRPFVEEVQKLGPGVPWIFYPKTEWGIWLLQTAVWLIVTLRIDKLRQMFGSDDRGTWQMPEYKALKGLDGGGYRASPRGRTADGGEAGLCG